MALDVSVTEYRHSVTSHEIGLTRDRYTTSILRQNYVPSWFSNPTHWQWQVDLNAGLGFQHYVAKYSEVTTQEPWSDIELFFQMSSGVRSGQIHNQPSRLLFPVNYPMMNIAAMASAAEALAGWFCEEHYHDWDFYTRPSRVTPDLIFRDLVNRRFALVEVKSSGNLGNPQSKITTEMINLLKVLAPMKLLNQSRYYLGLIMVQVASPVQVNLTSLILEEA